MSKKTQPIPILRSGRSANGLQDLVPEDPFQLETIVDFDQVTDDEMSGLMDKAASLGKNICEKQLSTQGKVTSFCGRNRLNSIPSIKSNLLKIDQILGKQLFVPMSYKLIRVLEAEGVSCSLVLAEIKHTLVLDIKCRLHQLTITNCSNLVIRMERAPIAGIECINSKNINIDAENQNFLRATTTSDLKISGHCNSESLLDIRNCLDVHVNNERIDAGIYTEGRYKRSLENDTFVKLSPRTDHLSGTSCDENQPRGARSLPDISLLKHHYTGKYSHRNT